MLSRNILNWLVLLILATVTRSEHYHIVPADSTDLCYDYRNRTCFTLKQLVQTDLLSGGDNLILSFLPGYHVLTEQLLICNFSHVTIIGQSTTVVEFHSNCVIRFVSIIKLIIECLSFIGANVGPQNNCLSIDYINDVYIKDSYFSDIKLFNQVETCVVKIANTQTAKIESTLFTNNTGRALHIDADYVYITNSKFTRNDGGAVEIESNNALIDNTKFSYNNAVSGGAVKVVSGAAVIAWCNFTNNKVGGAISVYSSSVFISNSELTNNSAINYGGAISVYPDSNVSISDSELTNNRADSGGAIRVSSGSVSISNSELTNNKADGGGAIRISSGSVSISNSELSSNRAIAGGAISVYTGSVSILDSELTKNSTNYYGGAISVYSGKVSISNSELTKNSAKIGGVISIQKSSMSILDSMLTNNSANLSGAIDISLDSSSIIYNTIITNNIRGSLNILQSNVTFTGMNIIVSNNGPIYAFNSRVEFNGPTTLINNRGVFGGAINAVQSEIYINTEGVIITNNTATSGGGIFLRESTLFVNEPIKIYHNTAHQDGEGIYGYSSRVEFKSSLVNDYPRPPNTRSDIEDNIAENNGGIYAVATTIKLTRSHVNIDSNTATASGGGVYLQQSSKLYILKKDYNNMKAKNTLFVTLMINNNLAQYGGGIFVADDTQRSACGGGVTEDTRIIFAECFFQTIKLGKFNNANYFNTFMTNNTATQSGADIYGGLLDRCTVNPNAEFNIFSNGSDYINNIIKSSTELSISSRPVQVMFCNKDYSNIITQKGHIFKISVVAVDQVGNPMNAKIRSSVITESGVSRLKEGQAELKVGNQCTELEYNVFSQDSSAQVELYADGPCTNLGISRLFINMSFQPCICPIGLKPIQSNTECKCDCDPVLQRGYQITNCSEKNGTIKLENNNNIWIQFINTTNGTGYVVSNCTFDYCVEKPVNIDLSNPNEQCAYNRSGVLCGECEPGLSLVLATLNCKKCSNIYLLLLIPFALAGILL